MFLGGFGLSLPSLCFLCTASGGCLAPEAFCVSPGGHRAAVKQLSEIQRPDSGTGPISPGAVTLLVFFLEASYVRCLRLENAGCIRGRSGRPGSFVSPWGRIGRL